MPHERQISCYDVVVFLIVHVDVEHAALALPTRQKAVPRLLSTWRFQTLDMGQKAKDTAGGRSAFRCGRYSLFESHVSGFSKFDPDTLSFNRAVLSSECTMVCDGLIAVDEPDAVPSRAGIFLHRPCLEVLAVHLADRVSRCPPDLESDYSAKPG